MKITRFETKIILFEKQITFFRQKLYSLDKNVHHLSFTSSSSAFSFPFTFSYFPHAHSSLMTRVVETEDSTVTLKNGAVKAEVATAGHAFARKTCAGGGEDSPPCLSLAMCARV